MAAQTRLSTTTCWRRIQQLEQNGVIKARVALLDRNALGLDVTIFAHVKLATTGRAALAEFEVAIRDRAEVLECYTLTGEWDFLLKIVTQNIKAFEAFYLDYLSRIPCVRSVNSSVAVTVIKESTRCPWAFDYPLGRRGQEARGSLIPWSCGPPDRGAPRARVAQRQPLTDAAASPRRMRLSRIDPPRAK